MLVSVFTPTNDASYLADVWRSLKTQTHKDFEWILVPNGDLKSLPKALTSDVRIKVFPAHDIFDNVGALKRFACEHCRGDLLVELDHDDFLTPRCLETLVAKTNPKKAQFLFSDFASVDEEMKPIVYDPQWGWKTYRQTFNGKLIKVSKSFEITPTSLSCLQFAPNHVRAWTRKAYDQAGGHSAELQIADDYDLILRTYLAGIEFVQIPECLYIYRVRGDSTSVQRNDKIQELQGDIYNQRVSAIVEEWCKRSKLKTVELAIVQNQDSKHEVVYPLNGTKLLTGQAIAKSTSQPRFHFPGLSDLADNSVGLLNCNGLLPFLERALILPFFEECYRVLADGGWFRCRFPSAVYSGGFANPNYRSYWTHATLRTFTNEHAAEMAGGHKARFQYLRSWDTWDNWAELWGRMITSCADLVAIKEDGHPGIIEI